MQNEVSNNTNKRIPDSLKWGGIAAVVIILLVCGVLLTRTNESSIAFMVRWKSALESGDIQKYDLLWGKNARNKSNTGYQDTAQLFKENSRIDVKITNAENRTRKDPQNPHYLRIEDIPILIYTPGEPLQQLRTLTIAKTGIIQQRWKLIKDQVTSEEITTDITKFEPEESVVETESSADSPVVPFVLEWKKALETKNVKKYTSLWDKKARKTKNENYQLAAVQISQDLTVDLSQAVYTSIAFSKTRYLVDNISVTIHSSGAFVETHSRTLTIDKRGFLFRRWKLINDEAGGDYISDIPIVKDEPITEEALPINQESDIFNGTAPLDTKLKVSQILAKWQTAWEEKDLETYMSIYAEKALITRVTVRGGRETNTYLNKRQLKQKMQKLNLMYSEIQVKISNLVIDGDRAVADVTFLQKFKGTPASGSRPAYSDIGTKKLDLIVDPADGYWKIHSETWSRYEDVPEYPKN
ncbi:nuclear transport factor 2 family protein [Candidatus Poribacteria bacterium]|nr:nuclear transport factor 2 family protein [Candidatus Poribacteria bacterium]